MAIAATREPSTERLPGDFSRHPQHGAPFVISLTKTKQRPGKKAELVAEAERAGIELPDKINLPELRQLLDAALGPVMAKEMYGRPSSLGKQIENMTNLQKWSERAVALGVFLAPELAETLQELDPDQLNLDDDQARELLDTIAVKAKGAAQAGIAAERGTHTHELTEDHDTEQDWIERARRGEDLGIPVEAQTALVAAWEQMLNAEGMEVLAVETSVVDDHWRQAGTLDRIVRLTQPRSFVTADGERVTLPAGWVGILDVKTGRLRVGRDQHPDYWHGYAVQIASYAQSVPYDTENDTRGEWDWEIDQRWAMIAHLDVLAALEGNATCRLVLVDLEAGRYAGAMCVAAREWEKRRDVFSLIDTADDVVVPVQAIEPEPDPVDEAAERAELLAEHARLRKQAEVDGWADEFRAQWAATGAGKHSTNAEVFAALSSIAPPGVTEAIEAEAAAEQAAAAEQVNETEARAEQLRRDEQQLVPDAECDAVVAEARAHEHVMIINAWLGQAHKARNSWSPRSRPSVRRVAITRAAIALATAASGDEDCTRLLVAQVIPEAEQPTIPIGVALADLTADEARRLWALCRAFGNVIALEFDESGAPRLLGDVAAALAAA